MNKSKRAKVYLVKRLGDISVCDGDDAIELCHDGGKILAVYDRPMSRFQNGLGGLVDKSPQVCLLRPCLKATRTDEDWRHIHELYDNMEMEPYCKDPVAYCRVLDESMESTLGNTVVCNTDDAAKLTALGWELMGVYPWPAARYPTFYLAIAEHPCSEEIRAKQASVVAELGLQESETCRPGEGYSVVCTTEEASALLAAGYCGSPGDCCLDAHQDGFRRSWRILASRDRRPRGAQ